LVGGEGGLPEHVQAAGADEEDPPQQSPHALRISEPRGRHRRLTADPGPYISNPAVPHPLSRSSRDCLQPCGAPWRELGVALRNAGFVLVLGIALAAGFKALDGRLPARSGSAAGDARLG
jgi:hypothetical protein